MDKYIEFTSLIYGINPIVEIIDEDEKYLYFYNNNGEKKRIEKNLENSDFEFVDFERYHDYISPWDDDWEDE